MHELEASYVRKEKENKTLGVKLEEEQARASNAIKQVWFIYRREIRNFYDIADDAPQKRLIEKMNCYNSLKIFFL